MHVQMIIRECCSITGDRVRTGCRDSGCCSGPVGQSCGWIRTQQDSFSAESREQLEIDDQCLEYAADGEFCFVEKENPGTVEEKIEKIILYRWNRVYPADVHFPIDFSGWKLVQAEEFAGSSHEKITEEIYERVK